MGVTNMGHNYDTRHANECHSAINEGLFPGGMWTVIMWSRDTVYYAMVARAFIVGTSVRNVPYNGTLHDINQSNRMTIRDKLHEIVFHV